MISIVIPAYNYAQFLPATISSVLQQGIDDLEIIVCDDCSTDNTQEVVAEFARGDARIKYTLNERNLGATPNINQSIKRANGEYVLLLGADDMLAPNGLLALKQALDAHPECGFAFGRYTMLSDDRHIPLEHPGWLSHDYFGTRDEFPDLLRYDCYINLGATLFRMATLGDEELFDTTLSAFASERFFRATDWEKVLKLSLSGVKSAFINQNISIFRIHGAQASSGDRYGRSGLAFFEHSVLLERYFTVQNIARLLPYLSDIIRLYQSKFEYFLRQALPECNERKTLAIGRADAIMTSIERTVTAAAVKAPWAGMRLLFPLGHFYSPIADPAEVRQREAAIWAPRESVPGVEMNVAAQFELLRALAPYTAAIKYPLEATPGAPTYHYNNNQFPGLDAEFLYAALCHLRPQVMIEVGSGFSSLITADVNRTVLGRTLDFCCIEPYPVKFLVDGVDGITSLLRQKVQDVELSVFDRLNAGDVLFIDSSHVSKVGSDVNHLFFEVLPRLKQGVIVHVHDIFLPDDYPKVWAYEGRNWNEQYLLQAFLQYNRDWEVMWMASYMETRHAKAVRQTFPRFPSLGGGSSLWMRRTRG